MAYYIFRLCKNKNAMEIMTKEKISLDMEKVAKSFPRVDFRSKELVSVEVGGFKASIYPNGRVLVFDANEDEAGSVAPKLFRVLKDCALSQEKREGVGLFVGRFQPFHYGHFRVAMDILRENRRLIIVIGSSEKSGTKDNPFSAVERRHMIESALDGAGIKNYEVKELPDFMDDKKWADGLMKVAKFDRIYSRNPWVARCMKKAGITPTGHKIYERYKHCGTRIRERIVKGEPWDDLVPKEVFEYIKKIKGEERIRKLNSH
jgi:nicotinamide-nucleotide adenylyltransferase